MTRSASFEPINHSWVALHPTPKGVIQFIGGAFFGTFFTEFFYQYLLHSLYNQEYTVVILPYNFTFNHYREAGCLLREEYQILPQIVRLALLRGYDHTPYLDRRNLVWMGHSLGCKYIALLEGFSALPEDPQERQGFIETVVEDKRVAQRVSRDIDELIADLRREKAQAIRLIRSYTGSTSLSDTMLADDLGSLFIKDQPSILLAPDNSGTDSAIRPLALAKLIDTLGLGVTPTPAETFRLIRKGNLFNYAGLVCFELDDIAAATCRWFREDFGHPAPEFVRDLPGGHLAPLGIQLGHTVFNPFDRPWVESGLSRNEMLETPLQELLGSVVISESPSLVEMDLVTV